MTVNPIRPERPDLRNGLGELMLAMRQYTTLSQRVFAERVGIKEGSLADIEINRRPCPIPVRERAEKVVDEFDAAVDKAVLEAEEILKGTEDVVYLPVSREPGNEWVRAVLGRAAVVSGLIVPTVDGVHIAL